MFLDNLFKMVDKFGQKFVEQSFRGISATLTGESGGVDILTLLLICYLIFWGVTVLQGRGRGDASEQVYRLFRVMLIYTFVTSWADFQHYIYETSQAIPSAIGSALLITTSQNATGTFANLNSADHVQTALQNFWNSADTTATKFMQTGGLTNLGPWIIGGIFYIAVALLVGYAAFLIILSKMFIWLVLALAPLFIALYLFEITATLMTGAFRVITTFIIVQIVTYAVVAFFLSITQEIMDKIVQSGDDYSVVVGQMMVGVMLCIIGVLLLNQIMTVAQNIAGAMGFSAMTAGQAGRFAKVQGYRASGAAIGAVAGIVGIGRGGVSVTRKIGSRIMTSGQESSSTETARAATQSMLAKR